jgi:hypothetical protein
MGDPRLFDTFTDHLFDLLREQGDPRKADRVRLTVEALRRTYNAYAKPTRALSTRKPLRATGTA